MLDEAQAKNVFAKAADLLESGRYDHIQGAAFASEQGILLEGKFDKDEICGICALGAIGLVLHEDYHEPLNAISDNYERADDLCAQAGHDNVTAHTIFAINDSGTTPYAERCHRNRGNKAVITVLRIIAS